MTSPSPPTIADRSRARQGRSPGGRRSIQGAAHRDGTEGPRGAPARRRARRLPPYGTLRIATLVAPRGTAPSLNRTKTRFAAGSNGTGPLATAKTANVGVSPAAIGSDTLGDAGASH